jgi:predicted transcriptional regulator
MGDTTMNIRLPADLKKAFEEACKANDQTASQELRAFIREYVKKHAQGRLLK